MKKGRRRRKKKEVIDPELQGRSFVVRRIEALTIDDDTILRLRAVVEDSDDGEQIGAVSTSIPILDLDAERLDEQIEDILASEVTRLVRSVEREKRAKAKKDAIVPTLATRVPSRIDVIMVPPPPPEEIPIEEVPPEDTTAATAGADTAAAPLAGGG